MAKKRSRKAAKQAANKTNLKGSGKPRLLLIDIETMIYQAIDKAQVEQRNEDDEWYYVVPIKEVKEELTIRIEELQREVGGKQVIVAVGSKNNWRKRIMPEYKANRGKKPLGYAAVLEWIHKDFECKTVDSWEADDVIGVLLTAEDFETEFEKVAVSVDKDFKSLPGLHYNPNKPENGVYEISLEEANHFHLVQTLAGDPTDGYKGCPGVGAVKAELILLEKDESGNCNSWYNIVNAFASVPANKGGALDEDAAYENARVARILRAEDLDSDGNMQLWFPEHKRKSIKTKSKKKGRKKRNG